MTTTTPAVAATGDNPLHLLGVVLVFRVLIPKGGYCSNNDNGGGGPAPTAPRPNLAHACGGPEISGTTKIISVMGMYCVWWPLGTDQRQTGSFQGGGGRVKFFGICTHAFRGRTNHGGGGQKRRFRCVRLKMTSPTRGPSSLG